jgi:PqqA peptide cyclase
VTTSAGVAADASTDCAGHRPYTLVAELTYRCPLACVYCSNPLNFEQHRDELSTAQWLTVLADAESLGVVQVNLSGGEPLLRQDLEELVVECERKQLYTNLITSGLPLTRERLSALRDAGLDNVQLSLQDVTAEASERISGKVSFEHKLRVAEWVKDLGLPLTLNVVLHRENLERVPEIVALAETLKADRLELANTQYLAWALLNRSALLPSAEQLRIAREHAASARRRLQGKMELLFVKPDYYSEYPRACMDGWGRRFLLVSPTGHVLPCHLAHTLPGLEWWSVRDRPLSEAWERSPGINAFRGESWMAEPCRSCERRSIDFGGCRCQAFYLAGNAALTDPACSRSPQHDLVTLARRESESTQLVPLRYRRRGNAENA